MAKKTFETVVDDLFAPPAEKTKTAVPAVVVAEEKPFTTTNVEPASVVTEQTQKRQASNKAIKQEVNTQGKSTKHTFPIPDDLWEDVETLLYALAKTGKKKKQNQLIIELLTKEVEANRKLIESYK